MFVHHGMAPTGSAMAQGQKLSDRQIETIRLAYAETGILREAARLAGCSPSSARRYTNDPGDELTQLRTEKRADIIEEIAAVRLALLSAMKAPEKIARASVTELATSFGILTDKHQLMTGKATARTETGTFDADALSPDQQETMADLIDLGSRRGVA